MTDNKWGGKREGAGRPKGTNNKKQYTFRLSDDELKAVKEVLNKMRGKLVILFLIFSFLCTPVIAQTIKGGVIYTEQNAKQIAFNNLIPKIKPITIKDDRYIFVLGAVNENVLNVVEYNGSYLNKLSIKGFGVVYKDEPNKEYIYVKVLGKYYLDSIDIKEKIEKNIVRTVKYYADNGELRMIFIHFNEGNNIPENESYAFKPNGKSYGHWVGTNGTADKNKIKATREVTYSAQ